MKRPPRHHRPGSNADVAKMVRFCHEQRIQVAPRGQGHTTHGRALIAGGLQLETAPVGLIDREDELAQLRGVLDAARNRAGGLAVVEGVPGSGKTALLQATAVLARDAGFQVLRARGSDLETGFGFGVARQLFGEGLRTESEPERERLLSGAAAHAGPLLGYGDAPDPLELSEPSFRALHGLYWLLAALAERSPVFVVIDDLQWADGASLRFLDFVIGRVDELPVAIAVAARTGERPEGDITVERLVARAGIHPIRPAPLTDAGIAALVADELGVEPDRAFVAACRRLAGGNAFYLVQLMAEVRAQGITPDAGAVERLDRLRPEAVGHVVLARLSRLSVDASELARALAILGDRSPLRRVANLAGLPSSEAQAAADALAAAALLDPDEDLSFVHPIVRLTVDGDMPAHQRSEKHRQAARLLAADGVEIERVAGHLLATTPCGDQEVVEQLRAAAGVAQANGAPDAAALYLARALAEPPDAASAAAVLEELGTAELLAGQPECLGHLGAALARTTDPAARARLAVGFAKVQMAVGQVDDSVATLRRIAIGLAEEQPALALALRVHEVCFARMSLEHCDAAVQRLGRLPDTSDDPSTRRLLHAARGFHDFAAGDAPPAEITARIRAALEGDHVLAELPVDHPAIAFALWPAAASGELDTAFDFVERMVAETTARGALMGTTTGLYWRAMCHEFNGSLADAEADARRSLDLAVANGWPMGVPGAASTLLSTLVERGGLDEAEEVLALAWGGHDEMPMWCHFTLLLEARAKLRSAQGRHEEALADLRDVGRRHLRAGMRNPAFSSWRSRLALAETRAGDRAEGLRLVDEDLMLARRSRLVRPLGIALRAAGQVRDDFAALEESVAALASTPATHEHAHSLVALGGALRRSNQRAEARGPLSEGMDLAQRCGALALAEQARQELAATGARPRRLVLTGVDALTASERRVAVLAANGQSNPEIAQSLFVTRSTIETHLHSIYRKLAISGRVELAAALGDEAKVH